MNEDAYAEWLVKRKDPAYAVPVKVLLVLVCVGTGMFALGNLLGIIVFFAALAATYFVWINLSIEFEYLVVEGEFSVDRVLAKSRRKKYFSCKKEEIQIVAPSDSYVLKDHEKSNMKVMDCSSGKAGQKTYTMICQQGSDAVKVVFEPNEKIIKSLRYSIPNKVMR